MILLMIRILNSTSRQGLFLAEKLSKIKVWVRISISMNRCRKPQFTPWTSWTQKAPLLSDLVRVWSLHQFTLLLSIIVISLCLSKFWRNIKCKFPLILLKCLEIIYNPTQKLKRFGRLTRLSLLNRPSRLLRTRSTMTSSKPAKEP